MLVENTTNANAVMLFCRVVAIPNADTAFRIETAGVNPALVFKKPWTYPPPSRWIREMAMCALRAAPMPKNQPTSAHTTSRMQSVY